MGDYILQGLRGSRADAEFHAATFPDDVAAIRHALSPVFPHGCEVWEGYRLVGRFYGPAEASDPRDSVAAAPRGPDPQVRGQPPQELGTSPTHRAA